MKRFLRREWSRTASLRQGVMAARRWMLAYVLLIVLPVCVMLFVYFEQSSRILQEDVTRTMQQTLKQAGINLSSRFDYVQKVSNSLFMNHKLYDNMDRAYPNSDRIAQTKELSNLLESVQTPPNIIKARVFTDPENLYGFDLVNLFTLDSLKESPWGEKVMDAGGSIVWTGNYKEVYTDSGEQWIFSCVRMLRQPLNFEQPLGVLALDIPEKAISDVISKLDFPSQSRIFIADQNGTIMYSPERSLNGTKVKLAGKKSDEGIFERSEGGADLFEVYAPIQATDWRLVLEVPKTGLTHRAAALSQWSGIATITGMMVMFLILVIMLMTFIVRDMNHRIKLVVKTIRSEGVEGLEDHRSDGGGNFYLLERVVDNLVHRVKDLMDEAYRSKMQEREAELRALQAQINPHFLYNTLDTINWLANARGADEISQMIEGLSDYFRLSLNKGRDYVSVADELELARVYLEIQQSRFPSTFHFTIEAEPEASWCMIPKLTLQPIVENALLHGIRKNKGKMGSIMIRAERRGDVLVICVADDGIGMDEELAASLISESRPMLRIDGSGSSYGLYNVNERIKLLAGYEYGLTIRSRLGEGTLVTVHLKAMQEVQTK
ncbi:two-component system sensor histidine kinase YesM [Paenibacillus rhizosphaerae]|uniref:histidine kinase n=1 Tax=Paenibacillus rhizosphaerae TaxID=297318 RepID=A0A839TG46_9BACL|nr:sensor histidine kinase [Paenibacillus rhizosphaerae]MBB3125473.1 two-component system sensor histidine kinase YesM [Paenibacillus rhizosphaerae]